MEFTYLQSNKGKLIEYFTYKKSYDPIHKFDFYIIFCNFKSLRLCFPETIENITKISQNDYIDVLKQFNAIKASYTGYPYIFMHKSNAEQAAEYLNEKYGVMLKLMGD